MEQNSAQSDKTNIPIFGNLGGAIPQFSVSQFAANNQNAGGVPSFSGANSEAPAMFGQGMDMDMCSGTASPSVPPQNLNMANPFSTMRGTMEPSLPSMKASVDPPATNSASRMPPDPMSWLEDSAKLSHLQSLKNVALSNARMLYGSDRNRYHDIVVASCPVQPRTKDAGNTDVPYIYSASLVITVESTTKVLRREIATDPLEAVAKIVRGVVRDTGILFAKYQPGQTFKGQQGVTQPVNSNFGAPGTTEFTLLDNEHNRRATGVTAPDDTRDVERHMHAPRGPRVDRYTPRSAPMYESFRTGGTSNGGRAANVTANEREIERATKRANVALDY